MFERVEISVAIASCLQLRVLAPTAEILLSNATSRCMAGWQPAFFIAEFRVSDLAFKAYQSTGQR